jgi:hypothetical protein
MVKRLKVPGLILVLACALPASVRSDDLTGANTFLCTAQNASVCSSDGDCESGPAGQWNIPQFIVVDLQAKKLSTTKASGENRSTPILAVERKDGTIFLQGLEMGRAFSFEIDEESGTVSVAVAREGIVVAVFGVCTPTQAGR